MNQLLYQGKAKQLLATPDPATIIVRFTDTVTALNGKKRATIPGKGALAAQISMRLFELLSTQNIPTHYIRQLDQQSFLAHKVQIIPLEVVVRHYATGSITKRLGIPKGRAFQPPLVEFFYKSDELGDPPLCEAHIYALGLATPHELAQIVSLAQRAAALLSDYVAQRDLKLVDIKFEFGRDLTPQPPFPPSPPAPLPSEGEGSAGVRGLGKGEGSRILLADEISPDTMRLWDARTDESLDKDVFREDKGDLLRAYQEVARRLNLTRSLSASGEGQGEVEGTGEVGTGEVGL
jgi:phosphoribosylaminoimidazole-succinocarboxamide synthase